MYWPEEIGSKETYGSLSVVNNGHNIDKWRKNIHSRDLSIAADTSSEYVGPVLELIRQAEQKTGVTVTYFFVNFYLLESGFAGDSRESSQTVLPGVLELGEPASSRFPETDGSDSDMAG